MELLHAPAIVVAALVLSAMIMLSACVEINVTSGKDPTPTSDGEKAPSTTENATESPTLTGTPVPTSSEQPTSEPDPAVTPKSNQPATTESAFSELNAVEISDEVVTSMLLTSENVSELMPGEIVRTILRNEPRYPFDFAFTGTRPAVGLSKYAGFCESRLPDYGIKEITQAEVVMQSERDGLFPAVISQSIHVLPDDDSADFAAMWLRTEVFGCDSWLVVNDNDQDVNWAFSVTEIPDVADNVFHVSGVPSTELGRQIGIIDLAVIRHGRFVSIVSQLLIEESFEHEIAFIAANKIGSLEPE